MGTSTNTGTIISSASINIRLLQPVPAAKNFLL